MLPTLHAVAKALWHPDLARPTPAKLSSKKVAYSDGLMVADRCQIPSCGFPVWQYRA